MKRVSPFAVAVTCLLATAACKKSQPQATPGSQAPQPEAVAEAPAPTPAPAAASPDDPWTAATQGPKRDPLPRAMFWSVTKDGKTTYLLGTMHMGVDAEARLPQIVFDKLDAAPVFALETNTSDPAILGMGARASGTLRDDLGPDYWKKLEALVEPALLTGLNKMKPAMTVAMLSMRGLPQTPPMDGVLLARAQRGNKEIVYLEAATKQAALLDKWLDVRSLKAILDDPKKGEENTRQMLAAYLSGDDAKLVALSDAQKADQLKAGITEAEYKQSMDEMLYDRNASWIPGIEKLHARGGGFVAVGALHLVGKRSVLDLLAAKGYRVDRVQ